MDITSVVKSFRKVVMSLVHLRKSKVRCAKIHSISRHVTEFRNGGKIGRLAQARKVRRAMICGLTSARDMGNVAPVLESQVLDPYLQPHRDARLNELG